VRSLERGRSGAGMLLSCSQQRLSLLGTQNADARRPCEDLRVRPSVVVAIRAVRVVNGIGKVRAIRPPIMNSSHGLCFASTVVTTKTHFTSCILSEAMGRFPV
jgi:hypothetical protein